MGLEGPFRDELRNKVRITDFLLISSVPIVLSLIFLLPQSAQQSLVLNYDNPSLFALWTSAYVHRGFSHFSNNTLGYCLLIIPIYSLFVFADERRLFRAIFVSFLVILPVLIGAVNIFVIGHGSGAGFSGIGSAYFGLLPVALFLFLHNRISYEVKVSHGVPLFLVATGFIAFTYSGFLVSIGVFLVAGLSGTYDIHRIGIDEIQSATAELSREKGYLELVLVATLLTLASPVLLFPAEIDQGGNVVNILSHYLGLVLGFFGPTSYLTYRDWHT